MFWDNFVRLCVQNGKKPNPVAAELGFSSASVTGWKQGKKPRSTTLLMVADYFGVTVDDLLREDAPVPSMDITPDEEMLLDLFRQVPADKRELVMQMIRVALGK